MLVQLASASPRRLELLLAAGFRVERVLAPDVDESLAPDETAPVAAGRLARLKLDASVEQNPEIPEGAVRLSADTLVESPHGSPLGKPESVDHLRAMIRELAGRTHRVCTGFAWQAHDGARHGAVETTQVHVGPIPETWVETYLDQTEPWDKAGGYAIQGLFMTCIDRIDGCWPNVVGLPVRRLALDLQARGVLTMAPWSPSASGGP